MLNVNMQKSLAPATQADSLPEVAEVTEVVDKDSENEQKSRKRSIGEISGGEDSAIGNLLIGYIKSMSTI